MYSGYSKSELNTKSAQDPSHVVPTNLSGPISYNSSCLFLWYTSFPLYIHYTYFPLCLECSSFFSINAILLHSSKISFNISSLPTFPQVGGRPSSWFPQYYYHYYYYSSDPIVAGSLARKWTPWGVELRIIYICIPSTYHSIWHVAGYLLSQQYFITNHP